MPPRPPTRAPPTMAPALSFLPAISRPASAPAPAPPSAPSIGDTAPGGGTPGGPDWALASCWNPAIRASTASVPDGLRQPHEACARTVLISLPRPEAVELEDLDHRDAAGLGLVGPGEVGLLRLHDLDEGQLPVAVLVQPRELGRVLPAQLVRRQHVGGVGVQRGEPPGHLARELGQADAAVAVDVREDELLPALFHHDLAGRRRDGGGGRRPAGAGVLAAGDEAERGQREGRCGPRASHRHTSPLSSFGGPGTGSAP